MAGASTMGLEAVHGCHEKPNVNKSESNLIPGYRKGLKFSLKSFLPLVLHSLTRKLLLETVSCVNT
jgi:hypothetical protein